VSDSSSKSSSRSKSYPGGRYVYADGRHDNGKHKGWYKGKGNKHGD
jgi:hypothetical protein